MTLQAGAETVMGHVPLILRLQDTLLSGAAPQIALVPPVLLAHASQRFPPFVAPFLLSILAWAGEDVLKALAEERAEALKPEVSSRASTEA